MSNKKFCEFINELKKQINRRSYFEDWAHKLRTTITLTDEILKKKRPASKSTLRKFDRQKRKVLRLINGAINDDLVSELLKLQKITHEVQDASISTGPLKKPGWEKRQEQAAAVAI